MKSISSLASGRRFSSIDLVVIGTCLLFQQTTAEVLKLENELQIFIHGKHVTSYLYSPDQKYPYFYPVNGPLTGQSVTTESSDPYPHHHSLFFGCDRVNGGNYWQDDHSRGQILSSGPQIVLSENDRVMIKDVCDWKQPGEPAVMRDERTVHIGISKEGHYVLDFQFILKPQMEVRIEKTNHSLFSVRMRPELSVDSGGTLVNAESETGELGTWGKRSAWCDMSGKHFGKVEGLAIFQSPRNPWYPSPWFTRDYGFLSPTPMYWLNEGVLRLTRHDVLVFRYRVIIHGGNAREAQVEKQFSEYLKTE